MSEKQAVLEIVGMTQEFLTQRNKIRSDYNVIEEIVGSSIVQIPSEIQIAGTQPKIGIMLCGVFIVERK